MGQHGLAQTYDVVNKKTVENILVKLIFSSSELLVLTQMQYHLSYLQQFYFALAFYRCLIYIREYTVKKVSFY